MNKALKRYHRRSFQETGIKNRQFRSWMHKLLAQIEIPDPKHAQSLVKGDTQQ